MISQKVKTGPFAEHSNTLWGISSLNDWSKVHSGLTKMFEGEVSQSSKTSVHHWDIIGILLGLTNSFVIVSSRF